MEINKKLINTQLDQKDVKDFKEYLDSKVKIEKPVGFQKFMLSIYAWLLAIILIIVGIVVFVIGFKNGLSGVIAAIALAAIVLGGLTIYLIFKYRKKYLSNSFKDLDFLAITQKWFGYYGVKSEKITRTDVNSDYMELISSHRKVTGDANIQSMTDGFAIEHNGITSTFTNVLWHWITRYRNSKGQTVTKHHYENQIYLFEEGFNNKWDDFEFNLHKGSTILRKKHESLENTKFNKMFNYGYNDEVKLRVLFTVATQELLVNQFVYNDVSISKRNNILLSTCKNKTVAGDFSPFEFNVGGITIKEEEIKRKLQHDLVSDYSYLMKFMGHSRLLFSLYKK